MCWVLTHLLLRAFKQHTNEIAFFGTLNCYDLSLDEWFNIQQPAVLNCVPQT